MINRYMRMLAVLLATMLVLMSGTAAVAETAQIVVSDVCEGLNWSLDSVGCLTVSGVGDMPAYDTAEAYPWYSVSEQVTVLKVTEGVTSVSGAAFAGCINLQSVILADSVAVVGENAFGVSSLIVCCTQGSAADAWAQAMAYTVVYVEPEETAGSAGVIVPGMNDVMLDMFDQLMQTAVANGGLIVKCETHVEQTQEAVAPTCTEDGYSECIICSVCGEVLSERETIPMTGHAVVVEEAVAATCTEAGMTAREYCETCGVEITAAQTVEALGHTEVTEEAVAATCTEAGMTAKVTCAVCGEVLTEASVVEALGHTEVIDAAVAATCTETGLTEGAHCEVCGEVLTEQQVVEATGHSEEHMEASEPTCTEAGWTAGVRCSICGETMGESEPIEALGHIEVIDAAVEATCTAAGMSEGIHCERCGEVLTEQQVINKLEHDGVVVDEVPATCTESGLSMGVYCSVCNEVLVSQKTIDALGHTEAIDAAVAPTCTETGLTEGAHCEVCGEVLTEQQTVDAAGHTEAIDAAVAPTCTETGLTEGAHCEVCGEVLTEQQAVEATGHTEAIDAAVEPTCSATGLTEGVHCEVCGEVLTEQQTVDALPHTEAIDAAVEATYLTTGLTEGKHCEVCGEVITAQEVVPEIKLPKPVMGQPIIISSLEQKLIWEEIEGVNGYELWRSDSANGEYYKIGETRALEMLDSTSLYGQCNYYKVRAFKMIDNQRVYSDFSNYRSCFGLATSGIAGVQLINNGVRVSVAAVANATSYYIYRCEEENGEYERLGVATLDEINQINYYDDLTVEQGKTYYYKARAFYISPDEITYVGSFSSAKSIVANYPSLVTPELGPVEIISSLELRMNWEAVEGMEGYELWRSDAPDGIYTLVGETTELTISDPACTFGQINYYKLCGYVTIDEMRVCSDFSGYRSGFGLATPGIASVAGGKIAVNPVANATGYYVYRCAEKDGLYERIGSITMETGEAYFVDMSAQSGCFYKVRAYYVSPEGVTYVGQFSAAKSE